MAEFLGTCILLVTVAVSAFHLGRVTQQDRIEFLLDELEAANSVTTSLMNARRANMARHLQAVRDDK
jgi:hypothetical protein